MTKEEIFAIWAPDNSPWSRWVKPVLFAHLDLETPPGAITETSGNLVGIPSSTGTVALVVDLPGAEGVAVGVALAGRGYRPVPLYNALPLPLGHPPVDSMTGRETAAVNMLPIMTALRYGATPLQLAQSNLPPHAPPAFLLDANRRAEGRTIEPGDFDNRSISFTSDFPSANFLSTEGIQRVMLMQKDRLEPRSDLDQTLRGWQDGGLKLERARLDLPFQSEFFVVARPPWYGALFQRTLSAMGWRRTGAGGFGAWMPETSAAG
jgi:hypothetical protein